MVNCHISIHRDTSEACYASRKQPRSSEWLVTDTPHLGWRIQARCLVWLVSFLPALGTVCGLWCFSNSRLLNPRYRVPPDSINGPPSQAGPLELSAHLGAPKNNRSNRRSYSCHRVFQGVLALSRSSLSDVKHPNNTCAPLIKVHSTMLAPNRPALPHVVAPKA